MSVENNGQASNADQHEENPFAVFNETTSIMGDEDEDLVVFDDQNFNSTSSEEFSEEEEEEEKEELENHQKESDDILSFEEEEEPSKKTETETTEELIERLKKEGYKISKDDANDPTIQEQNQIEKIDQILNDANNFISQNDEVIVREKIKNDLAVKYRQQGRENQIGSEDFLDDLEVEFDQYSDNATTLKLYADNIRRDVKDTISAKSAEKKTIEDKRNAQKQKESSERKQQLQNDIRSIVKSGLFGMNISNENAKEIYKSITSGEFTKSVNNSPELVAEFATYIKNREEIQKRLGGPTYGEGVKAAVEALEGKSSTKSKSPLSQAMNNSSSAQGVNNRKASWGMPVVDKKNEEQEKVPGNRNAAFL